MSLSARIAVGPSRFLEAVASSVAIGGFFAVAATLAERAGTNRWAWFALAFLASGSWLLVRHRRVATADRHVVVLSDRIEIGLSSTASSLDRHRWELDRSSMAWPGFVVLALREGEGRAVVRLPILDAECDVEDRRALHRYLLWAMRGGAGPARVLSS